LSTVADLLLEEKIKRREAKPQSLARFREDPLGFTMWDFPWGRAGTPLEHFDGPDTWQKEFLAELGEQVRSRHFDGHTPVAPIKMTRSAGKGVGKSVLVAILCNYIIKTWPFSQGTITANTFSQLETKTWAAIQHWFGLSRSSNDFIVSGAGVQHKIHKKSWQCHPETCREENAEAFAGQHAANSVGFFILDESSAVPEKIFETAESQLVDGMPMIFAFGNPTRSSGKFFKINFGIEKNRWNNGFNNGVVDARDCKVPNKKTIAEEIEYRGGEEDDYVRVYIRGLPPNASDMQYIDSGRVFASQVRVVEVLSDEPVVAGVDLARGGGDKAVIRFRQGDDARSIPPIKIPAEQTRDSMLLVAKLADLATRTINGKKVAAWFVDGGGIGGPIIDRLQQLGHKNFFEIQFGAACPDPRHFANMRAWMWSRMRDALGSRLAIDKDRELEMDLTSVGLGRPDKTDRIILESKEDMRKRGLASPDDADALCFVKNTMIRTAKGLIPIQDVREGDMVLTPFGYSDVVMAHVSDTCSLTTVGFSNGAALSGKGSHEVFTFQSGRTRLDALSLTSEVDTYSQWRRMLWQLVSLSFTGARSFGFKQAAHTFNLGERTHRRDFFTAGFTRSITDISQRGLRFITRMTTGATTILETSNFALVEPINESICENGSPIQRQSPRTMSILRRLGPQQPNGTDLQRESLGTANSARKHGRIGRPLPLFAKNAERTSRPTLPAERERRSQSTAPPHAYKPFSSGRISQILEFVVSAAYGLWRIVIGRRPVVPLSVQTESVSPTPTYNLTLREHNAYYANGILVFNCLTWARPVLAPEPPRKKREEPFSSSRASATSWMG